MPQSLSKVILHIIFSTKNREPWLDYDMQPRMLLRRHGVNFDERYVWD